MSRWMMPLRWASPSPAATWTAIVQRLLRLQRPLLDPVPERLPFHVLHGDVGTFFAFPDLMDDADVRMGQGRGRLGLDEEPLLELGRVHQVRRQELQGHASLELEVLGLVDDAHPAVADLLDDPVFAGDEAVLRYDRERCRQGFRQGGLLRPRFSQGRRAVAAESRVGRVLRMTFRAFHGTLALPDARILSPREMPVNDET